MTAVALPDAEVPARPAPTPTVRRPEIDGLRALAVALVVGYHVFTGRVSGGVDVFLVLTGFFLVQGLVGQHRRTGRIDPVTPIVRSLSRLVPAAAVVLAVTAAAAAVILPETRWRDIAAHLISSLTFTENLRLVDEAVTYGARDAATSPMQQFWSLSIQVQVLVVVPLLVAAVAWRGSWGRYGRPLAVGVVLAATAASFAWSVVTTEADQRAAYFSTLPRLWEIGAGALAALLLSRVRPGPRTAVVIGWVSVLALVACGALVDGARLFPGWQAAWPVLCALGVLVAADAGGRAGVHRVLALRPLKWLGLRSYSLYLWHWPVLVLYLAAADRETPSLVAGSAIILGSLLLTAVTYRLVERPAGTLLRSQRPVGTLVLVAVLVGPLLVAGVTTQQRLDGEAARFVPEPGDPRYPGAAALLGPDVATGGIDDVEPAPGLASIRLDGARMVGESDCRVEEVTVPVAYTHEVCVLGPDDAERRIVVVGDSHSAHWLPPLSDLARERGWQLVGLVRPGCNLSTRSEFLDEDEPEYAGCAAWRSQLVDRITALRPDAVVALGTRTTAGAAADEVVPPGFVEAWRQLADRGVRVIAMRDTPRRTYDVPDCLAEAEDEFTDCALDRDVAYDDAVLDTRLPAGVTLLDTSRYFCADDVCPALVGNLRVYLDDTHLTTTYLRTVTPLLEADLLAVTGWEGAPAMSSGSPPGPR
ncbi:UNVERIFIED_ORG: acyltransferase [Bacillus sp. AZ43]